MERTFDVIDNDHGLSRKQQRRNPFPPFIIRVGCAGDGGGAARGNRAHHFGIETRSGALLGLVEHGHRREIIEEGADNGREQERQGISAGGADTIAIVNKRKIEQHFVEEIVHCVLNMLMLWDLWDSRYLESRGWRVEEGRCRIVAWCGGNRAIGPEDWDF